MRQETVSEFATDEEVESFLVDSGLAVNHTHPAARFTWVSTPERQPLRPGCRRAEGSTTGLATSGEEAAVSDAASRRARGDVLHERDGALADERDGHGMGAHAVATRRRRRGRR